MADRQGALACHRVAAQHEPVTTKVDGAAEWDERYAGAEQVWSGAHDAERALLAAVAPGGTLLVVHHADVDAEQAEAHGFDPADYVSPADVAALLDDRWRVEVHERRPRHVDGGAGAHHTHDLVLRALRVAERPRR